MESGKLYSIQNLFSDNRKIVIPDMQREYCWSDKRHGEDGKTEIVSSFLDSLHDYSQGGSLQLGLIYAYENPENFVYLCDGQQRLTTIYLLLGMLYRRLPDNEVLRRILVSEYEEEDDFEPRLQYAIRESTLYFLRDLAKNYFIEREDCPPSKISTISDWFYKDYLADPTIQNVLSALERIEKKLNDFFPADRVDNKVVQIGDFADFIANKLKVFYFDMRNRKYGEEQFVVINTTGKSLTFSEIIKPFLLGKLEGEILENESNKWEKWEKYFWDNRTKNEHEADKGMQSFLEWYLRIKHCKDDVRLEDLKEDLKKETDQKILNNVDLYFKSLKILSGYIKAPESKFCKLLCSITSSKKNTDENLKEIFRDLTSSGSCQLQHILLPLLAFIVRFDLINAPDEEMIYKALRRLRKNYFSKDESFKERKHEYVDWRSILKMIEYSDSIEKFLQFDSSNLDDYKDRSKGDWYSDYEQLKNCYRGDELEEIEHWEDHPDFLGDASFIFKSSLDNIEQLVIDSKCYDFDFLKRIYKNFEKLSSLYVEPGKLSKEDNVLFNNYRLYQFFLLNPEVGHLHTQSWIYDGCRFSAKNRNLLSYVEFMKVCASDNMNKVFSEYNSKQIKSLKLFELNEDSSTKQIISAWFSIKVLAANREGKVLYWYDNYGIACYHDKNNNRIFKNKDFNIYNLICGYTKKGEVCYAGRDCWDDRSIERFDSFRQTISSSEFDQLKKGSLSEEDTNAIYEKHKEWIDELIAEYN